MVGRDFDLRRVNSENVGLKISDSKKHDYPEIFRGKTTSEFLKLSAAVMGIEFAYSIETAFVSPILLELGLEHERMTMVWALSPLLGLLFAPFLGSLSDRCNSKLGRRRPLIIFLCIGIFLGMVLVPFGKDIGLLLGDKKTLSENWNATSSNLTASHDNITGNILEYYNGSIENGRNETGNLAVLSENSTFSTGDLHLPIGGSGVPIIAVILTVFGTVLMDFDADVCQSPIRAFLLEVTLPEDHARGLSIFTVMTGVGGFLGYVIGGIDWNALIIGRYLGGNIKTVFTLIMVIFIICIVITLSSFREIPLPVIKEEERQNKERENLAVPEVIVTNLQIITDSKLDTLLKSKEVADKEDPKDELLKVKKDKMLTFSEYFKSLTSMPNSLKILFLTNLFTWMSHLSYSLYFTDFVGECVFGGDPTALPGTPELDLYNQGVRYGCWGLALYCLACAAYSTIIDWLIKVYRAKAVFIGGLLFFSGGMATLALVRTKLAVLILSTSAGVAYSTLSTIPYLILAQYHTKGKFSEDEVKPKEGVEPPPPRGLGMDMAIIGSTIFLAQLSLSLVLGWLIELAGGACVVIWTAAILSAFSAIAATQVTYLDL